MAELQKNIRRVGGELESFRGPHGRRLLLPSEVDLCKTLGISEDEYWFFVDQTSAYNGKRKEGYELIPDIRAGGLEVVAFTVLGTKVTWGAIYLQVALFALGYLLAPKPKEIKQGATIKGADAIGSKRFAPQASFNSLQELANLGDTIPLVFANQLSNDTSNAVIGGVRVNSQLLWSQLLSLGRLQQLKAIVMFSLGEIHDKPDFEGYAIGDLLLSTYSKKKLDLFFKSSPLNRSNRIIQSDRYTESEVAGMPLPHNDVFSDSWIVGNTPTDDVDLTRDTHVYPFSGSRNPTTQVAFGLYSPMPNANVVKLPYEFIFETRGMDEDSIKTLRVKQKKINTWWPTRAGFTGAGNGTVKGEKITYQIMKSVQPYDQTEETGTYPHGVEDVISMVRSIREGIDANSYIGDTYMAGDALISCIDVEDQSSNAPPGTPWREERVTGTGIMRIYTFEVEEVGGEWLKPDGSSYFSHPNLYEHNGIPTWGTDILEDTGLPHPGLKVDNITIKNRQDTSDWSMQYGFPYRNPILQKVALGTVTNSRPCDVTEIGLKSKVFNQVRGTNLNSIASAEERTKIFNDRGAFQPGQMDLFLDRISFFKLQVRKTGTNNDWTDLSNNNNTDHSGIFCVKGNTPEFQYNYIKITHPEESTQFEYRFKPYPGNMVAVFGMKKKYNLLNATVATVALTEEEEKRQQKESSFICKVNDEPFVVTFAGQKEFILDIPDVSNTEWIQSIAEIRDNIAATEQGDVVEIDKYTTGVVGNIQLLAGPINPNPPDPEPSYVYNTTAGESHNETLVSLNTKYGLPGADNEWAWVVYENGVEVGVEFTKKDTKIEDVTIESKEKFTSDIVGIRFNDDGTQTKIMPVPRSKKYQIEATSAGSQDPFVDRNPINGEEVAYYKLSRKPPKLTVPLGIS